MVIFSNIPEIMRELNHWVLWTKDKAPHQIKGKMAKSNDPNTWSSFSKVLKYFDSALYEEIGFMFTGSGITGIDIDHCIDNGRLSTLAQEIIDMCNSYTENSPSSTGIHIYIQGVVPRGIKREKDFDAGVPLGELSSKFGRNMGATQTRLLTLGKKFLKNCLKGVGEIN